MIFKNLRDREESRMGSYRQQGLLNPVGVDKKGRTHRHRYFIVKPPISHILCLRAGVQGHTLGEAEHTCQNSLVLPLSPLSTPLPPSPSTHPVKYVKLRQMVERDCLCVASYRGSLSNQKSSGCLEIITLLENRSGTKRDTPAKYLGESLGRRIW